ncbi:MAG: hypothetical protein AMXMBFR34_28210 [Myxococcaceae bacterium]
MNSLRIGLLGLVAAVAGFALSGCFASQPTPECSVQGSSAGLGITPYHVALTKVDATGTCGDMPYLVVGTQRSRLPPAMGSTQPVSGGFTMHIKTSPSIDMYNGFTFSADSDPSNDCSLFDGDEVLCDMCVASGDPAEENVCMPVPDPVYRVDPADPDQANVLGTAKLPQYPTDGVCTATEFSPTVQNFQEEVVDLIDGGTETFPALTVNTEWSAFEILASSKAPGTVWRAKLKYTEGNCVANFDAFAFWPELHCSTTADGVTQEYADEECNPKENLNTQCFPEMGGPATISTDGGCDTGFITMGQRVLGSGMNPEFKPKCDMSVGFCTPTVTFDDLKD